MTTFNFCAGPAMLPKKVLEKAQLELVNWQNTGCSVMEISHRSPAFIKVYEEAVTDLKELMSIPDDYSVLFMHGGGRGQFSAAPLNLFKEKDSKGALYITTGSWSSDAIKEAEKYGSTKEVKAVSQLTVNGKTKVGVAEFSAWQLDQEYDFVHYCPNETVDGIEIFESPKSVTRNQVVVADMSSTILSRKINVKDYDVIYAGAQKNIGPSGLTLVIIKNALLERSTSTIPSIMNYELTATKDSMFNTPPTFAIYLAGLVFKWLKNIGGVEEVEKTNIKKAELLYKTIDNSKLYENNIIDENRSRMNVVFRLPNERLEAKFLLAAAQSGLVALKGHRSVGGIRASIYNAMPLEGVQALVDFMNKFEKENSQ